MQQGFDLYCAHTVIRLELRAEQPSADAPYSSLITVDIPLCLSLVLSALLYTV